MALPIGAFFARLGIDTSEYSRGILSAQAQNAAFGQTFAQFVANPIAGSIDLFKKAAGGVLSLINNELAFAERIDLLRQRSGLAVETIQALEKAFDGAGGSIEEAATLIDFFTRAVGEAQQGNKTFQDAFSRLGLDPAQFRSADEAIRSTLDAIARLPNESARAAAAAELLGARGLGTRFISAVEGSSKAFDELIGKFRDFGHVADSEMIAKLVKAEGDVENLQFAFEGLKRALTQELIAGFVEEFGLDTNKLRETVRGLIDEIGPKVRDFGKDIGSIAKDIQSLASDLERIKAFFPSQEGLQNNPIGLAGRAGASVREFLQRNLGGQTTVVDGVTYHHPPSVRIRTNGAAD